MTWLTPEAPAVKPRVSVIVPARNEEACLAACLESLLAQGGVEFEVIVIDDGSTDRTRQIAESFPGVRVLTAAPLPSGWSGKCNAAASGAQAAGGEWLLFTDADTVHQPGSLARALAEAVERQACLLSYSPRQDVRGFGQLAVMPVIFAELALSYRPREVSDAASPVAAANGQYLLIWRETYDAIGGHRAVASEILEDVALARAVKQSGRRIFFRLGGDAVRTRMYRTWEQLREGWTKNLAQLFPQPVSLAGKRAIEFLFAAGGMGAVLGGLIARDRMVAIAGALVALPTLALFFRRILRAHFRPAAILLSPLGLPLFVYLLLRSAIHTRWRRQIAWKGRTYLVPRSTPGSRAGVVSDEQITTGAK